MSTPRLPLIGRQSGPPGFATARAQPRLRRRPGTTAGNATPRPGTGLAIAWQTIVTQATATILGPKSQISAAGRCDMACRNLMAASSIADVVQEE